MEELSSTNPVPGAKKVGDRPTFRKVDLENAQGQAERGCDSLSGTDRCPALSAMS